MIKGIDVSDNNGKIDWAKVKESGVKFAIIRLGFGNDEAAQDDKRFSENVAECERLGIPWGAYIYSYALNTAEALSEAEHCLRLLKGKKPSYPVCFDMEDADGYKAKRGGLSKENSVQICNTFLDTMERNGYYVALYASLSWLTGLLNDSRLDRFDKWVAQWNTKCEYSGSYGLWQYGGSTNFIESPYLNGVSGAVDKNYAIYDYPEIIKANGLNGWPVPEKEIKKEPVNTEPQPEVPEVKEDAAETEKETPKEENAPEIAETVKEEKEETKPQKKSGILAALKQFLKLILAWIRS